MIQLPPFPLLFAGLCALLAACAVAPGTTPDAGGRPASRLRVLAAGALPGVVPLVGPTWLGSCTPTPVPAPSVSAPRFGTMVIVSGMVYDPDGLPAEGAVVVARSLDASVPYTATATTFQGAWVFYNIPEGARMSLLAIHDGWVTSRYEFAAAARPAGVLNILDLRAEPAYVLPVASSSPAS